MIKSLVCSVILFGYFVSATSAESTSSAEELSVIQQVLKYIDASNKPNNLDCPLLEAKNPDGTGLKATKQSGNLLNGYRLYSIPNVNNGLNDSTVSAYIKIYNSK